MNITVFGANGQIGQEFLRTSLNNDDKVKAVIRREGALEMTHPNLEIIIMDYNNEIQMKDVVAGQDAVVSTLGPNLNGGRKIKNLPIRDAHEIILKVMEEAGVKRFITLGTPAVKSGHDKKQMATIIPAVMPKLFFPPGHAEMKGVEKLVKKSTAEWTVVRIINPNAKTDGNGYTVSLGDTKAKFNVSRKNAAKCMYDAINKKEWIGTMPIVFNK